MHKGTTGREHRSNHQMRRTPSTPSATRPPPLPPRGARELHKGGGCAPRARGCGWQRDQPTARGTVNVARRREILVHGGGGQGGIGVGAHKGHPGAPTDRGRSNTATQTAGATPGGTRASAADKEEGGSKAGEGARTAGTWNQKIEDGRACAWGAAVTQGMAWPASPIATGCQGNPYSTGIRWGVPPAAQMGYLCNRRGSPPGANLEVERDDKGPPAHTPHQHQHQQPTQGRPAPPPPPPMVPPAQPSVPLHRHFAQQEQ